MTDTTTDRTYLVSSDHEGENRCAEFVSRDEAFAAYEVAISAGVDAAAIYAPGQTLPVRQYIADGGE